MQRDCATVGLEVILWFWFMAGVWWLDSIRFRDRGDAAIGVDQQPRRLKREVMLPEKSGILLKDFSWVILSTTTASKVCVDAFAAGQWDNHTVAQLRAGANPPKSYSQVHRTSSFKRRLTSGPNTRDPCELSSPRSQM